MARRGIFYVAIFALFTTVTFQDVNGIKCWDCTSTASFCDDPFDENNVSDKDRTWSYIECLPPVQSYDQRAVCKKIKQIVNDMPIISRSCFWANTYGPNTECVNENAPSSVKTEFCETCDTDGCNDATQHGPILMMILVPAIATKFALF